ncbi:MAG: type IV secretory system conjugative DNA transfer family protein [Novosphingobium sp.]|nr:type IV secretory system conjugative DNA transfer family protein [Novosphingobium sp.]
MIVDLPRGWDHSQSYPPSSTAEWLPSDSVASGMRFASGQVFLGQVGQTPIGIRDDRHAMTIAGSRAGKGVSALIPNLLLYPGSMFVIDPKGELATITAGRRGAGAQGCKGMGQDVHVLDPFRVTRNSAPQYLAGYNPLDRIDPDDDMAVDEADLIAESLIYGSSKDRDLHWTLAARNLIKGLILYICQTEENPERRNLIEVRRLLNSDELQTVIRTMEKMGGDGPVTDAMAQEAIPLLDMGDNERGSVLSTARTQTKFLSSPPMRSVLERSNFSFGALKEHPTTIYLCLPAMRMGTHNRWLRLLVNAALSSMERERCRPPHGDIIFLLDEFPVLGRMESIQAAIGQIAGFGVKLWTVIQDISQIKEHYPESWESYIGNSCFVQCFGNTDLATTDYISQQLGQITTESASISDQTMAQRMRGQSGVTISRQTSPLLRPDEVARFFARQHQNQLLMLAGRNPIQIERVNYFADKRFLGLFEADPAYG